MIDPKAEYERRLADRQERIAALDRINFTISNIRLAIALIGAIVLWMAFVRMSISPAFTSHQAYQAKASAAIPAWAWSSTTNPCNPPPIACRDTSI